MKVLIVEDEPQAAQRLTTLVREIDPGVQLLGTIDTVKKAVVWFQENAAPDLVLMDIQLADGLSFQIFDACRVTAPVIFTTAYDEYALKAFKLNSIDYILKPVDKDELRTAFEKFKNIRSSVAEPQVRLEQLAQAFSMLTKRYKSRFVVKVGEHLRTIEVEAIRFFYSQDKTTFCVTEDNRNHILDFTLEELEGMIDPDRYFRINRKYLVSPLAIQDIIHYTNSRLKLVLKGSQDSDVIVARERVQEFKQWLDR